MRVEDSIREPNLFVHRRSYEYLDVVRNAPLLVIATSILFDHCIGSPYGINFANRAPLVKLFTLLMRINSVYLARIILELAHLILDSFEEKHL